MIVYASPRYGLGEAYEYAAAIFEKEGLPMRKHIFESYEEMSRAAALVFAERIRKEPSVVLGLATGSTPLGLYNGLVSLYEAGELDFSDVVSYNLDEYYPIARGDAQSYHHFMHANFFNRINIKPENIHLPDGRADDPDAACAEYEMALRKAGIGLQLLGVGDNGHIGFNEPAEALRLDTHKTALTDSTINANSRFFASPDDVPKSALTMGMGSIMTAKSIVVLVSGARKAPVLHSMFSGRIDPACPASLLQLHPDVLVLADRAAAS